MAKNGKCISNDQMKKPTFFYRKKKKPKEEPRVTNQNEHTPPYLTTTVFPRSELAALEIVSATSEKFSGAAEMDVFETVFDVNNVDDGAVKADAAENKVAVRLRIASFIVVAGSCVLIFLVVRRL